MDSFKIGDIVILKSGGPKMTVNHVIGAENGNQIFDRTLIAHGYQKGDVNCEWFDGNQSKKNAFIKETIKKSE